MFLTLSTLTYRLNPRGPGGLYETHPDPWDDSNSNQAAAQAAWTVRVAGTTSPSLDGDYKIWETGSSPDWSAATGHTNWWEGFTFTAEANADKVCRALSAQVRQSDDGSWECGEDRCFFAAITGNAAKAEDCMQKIVDAPTDQPIRAEFKAAYKSGAGMCLVMPAATKVYNKWYKVSLNTDVTAAKSMTITASSKTWLDDPSMANYCNFGDTCREVAIQVDGVIKYPAVGDTFTLNGVAVTITAIAAIAPPYYNSYDDANAKVINDCYTYGGCAWDAVDRGSNQLNETHYNSRSIGYQV